MRVCRVRFKSRLSVVCWQARISLGHARAGRGSLLDGSTDRWCGLPGERHCKKPMVGDKAALVDEECRRCRTRRMLGSERKKEIGEEWNSERTEYVRGARKGNSRYRRVRMDEGCLRQRQRR